ncbi:hypothetical protein [Devosia sediminis]|uniref:Uncharacterized protein n=1 Tax=Devosia sediminis TaxID=2798801 RepID=A0A934IN85_9HYPH|nr:hypothetical protein [Devosia sediminis]MBJ3783849.1 hypothetical protein [Devosia sediminis]
MQFLSFIGAITVFLIGVALAALEVTGWPLEITVIASVGVIGFIISGAIAYSAAKPIPFEFVGGYPSAWFDDIAEDKPMADALLEQLHHYEKMLQKNRASMDASARALKNAATAAGLTVGCCGASAVMISVFRTVASLATG